MVLAYVTNRAIMERLDNVCGPEGWRNEYIAGPSGGLLCGLSIKVEDEWITKWDGAENTDIESVKGGLSNAMKRAAVQWGIGRYLYNLDATYVNANPNGKHWQKGKQGKYDSFKWDAPALPTWALPEDEKPETPSDPYDDVLPDSEKDYFLNHPGLSDKQKDYLKTHPLTESLKYKIDEQIAGMNEGQKELI
jgi:hypothetical protein